MELIYLVVGAILLLVGVIVGYALAGAKDKQ